MAKFDLGGKQVLITGGARGIGRCAAARFADAGAKVIICDLDGEVAEQTAKDLGIEAHALDVTDGPAFSALVESIEAKSGPIEVLVNNAGIMSLGNFVDQPERNDRLQIEVNLHGPINGMRALLPRMTRRGRGRIVNVASMAGRIGVPSAAVYSATKHALIGLTESIRLENRGSGVRFSYVMPAPVKTELIAGARELKFPPLVEPEEVAEAIVDAVIRGRLEVYVPRIGRLLSFLPGMLPLKARDFIGDVLGIPKLFVGHDPERRKAYEARTTDRAKLRVL